MVSRTFVTALMAATALTVGGATAVGATPHRSHARPAPTSAAAASAAPVADTTLSPLAVPGGLGAMPCAGGSSPITHVIYLQFDNTHLRRDRAGVPSDLEQMPHLLNFLRGNGTLLRSEERRVGKERRTGGRVVP